MKSETIEYTVGGQSFTGYLAYDETRTDPRPGILLIHEWWGHNAFVREQADQVAALGYTAFALDMYGTGKGADTPDEAKQLMQSVVGTEGEVPKRFNAAMQLLQDHATVDPDRMAAQGYCFGGAVALNMARLGADLKGVVSFHGNLSSAIRAKAGDIKAALQIYTGGADAMIPADQVADFVKEMQEAGVKFELISYPGVQHGFTNPAATGKGETFNIPLAYSADAANDAREGAAAFYRKLFS